MRFLHAAVAVCVRFVWFGQLQSYLKCAAVGIILQWFGTSAGIYLLYFIICVNSARELESCGPEVYLLSLMFIGRRSAE